MPSAVRVARETAELALSEWGISAQDPAVGPALLILGELVTNSVRHAAVTSGQVTVTYAAAPHTFAFGVHDRHPYQPPLHSPELAASGGGLATVVELTHELAGSAVVRADADGGGKSVWITLPLQRKTRGRA